MSAGESSERRVVTGRAVVVRGNDIDTDRIIPARYMKAVSFAGLERYVFQDERVDAAGKSKGHPFDDPARRGAAILVVNKNFGCGSSREHAPQALHRWGIRAVVGESFAEIFFGNCVALGVPCVTLARDDVLALMEFVEAHPDAALEVDVEHGVLRVPQRRPAMAAAIPEGARSQLLAGSWDALGMLLGAGDAIEATAERLPYMDGFARARS